MGWYRNRYWHIWKFGHKANCIRICFDQPHSKVFKLLTWWMVEDTTTVWQALVLDAVKIPVSWRVDVLNTHPNYLLKPVLISLTNKLRSDNYDSNVDKMYSILCQLTTTEYKWAERETWGMRSEFNFQIAPHWTIHKLTIQEQAWSFAHVVEDLWSSAIWLNIQAFFLNVLIKTENNWPMEIVQIGTGWHCCGPPIGSLSRL